MGVYGMSGATGKGPYRHQTAKWKGALAVACGDAIFGDTSDLDTDSIPFDKPAASFVGSVDHGTTQASFKALFRGYSEVRRTTAQTAIGTDATDGAILATGEFTKPCTALLSAAIPGAMVGPAQGVSTTTLSSTNVEIVTNVSRAIGVLTRGAIVGATELTFEIFPVTFDRGITAIA